MAEVELPNTEEIEELRSKRFTRGVALTTALFAVMLAITSLGGNNAMKGMLLAQQQASDQWAFYQSKVIREHMYRLQRMQLAAGAAASGRAAGALADHLAKEEERYRGEAKGIEKEAQRLEKERDVNNARDPYFDYAEVLLQIAIVMASISILSLSRSVFVFAVVSAVMGTVLSINGFLLIFRIPFLH